MKTLYKQHFQPHNECGKKAKAKAVKLEAGEKYKPISKPKHIEFGDDDCGEDFSSIAWIENITCPC
eukprot:12933304-Prorocentrum_lima.AAC.1